MLMKDSTCSKGALLGDADILWPGHAVPPGRLPGHRKGQPGSTQRLPTRCCICFQGPCGSAVGGFISSQVENHPMTVSEQKVETDPIAYRTLT